MELPPAAYPIPDLWADNQGWADAWRWLHRRRPQGFNGGLYIPEPEVLAYASRKGIDGDELMQAVDAVDQAYFAFVAESKPKGR